MALLDPGGHSPSGCWSALQFGMIVVRPVSVCLRSWGWFRVSMEPQPWPEPAAEVVQAVKAKYRRREVPLPMAVRDRFGELFADAEFACAFRVTGPRGWSPGGCVSA